MIHDSLTEIGEGRGMEKDHRPMEQTHVFTLRLRDRGSRALLDGIDDLRAAVRQVKEERPFRIDCAVILPDHLHMIWTLPAGDAELALRWQRIKALFSRGQMAGEGLTEGQVRRGEKGIWQRRFLSHQICGAAELEARRAWILAAPVRAGLVPRAEDWPWGSGAARRQPEMAG
jgi:putative transposase